MHLSSTFCPLTSGSCSPPWLMVRAFHSTYISIISFYAKSSVLFCPHEGTSCPPPYTLFMCVHEFCLILNKQYLKILKVSHWHKCPKVSLILGYFITPQSYSTTTHSLYTLHFIPWQVLLPVNGGSSGVTECAWYTTNRLLCVSVKKLLDTWVVAQAEEVIEILGCVVSIKWEVLIPYHSTEKKNKENEMLYPIQSLPSPGGTGRPIRTCMGIAWLGGGEPAQYTSCGYKHSPLN